MPFPIVNVQHVRQQIDNARVQIGRDISIFIPVLSACTQCTVSGYYDTISNHSTYFTCPECRGQFWKEELEETVINARVHWTGNEAINATPGGKYFTGDGYFHVEPEKHQLIRDCMDSGHVVIDEQEMNIIRINPQGAPEINRYRAIVKGNGASPQG